MSQIINNSNIVPASAALFADTLGFGCRREFISPMIDAPMRQDWTPRLNWWDVLALEVPTDTPVKLAMSTHRTKNQFKVTCAKDWAFEQLGRAIAHLPYWTLAKDIRDRQGRVWHVMKHKFMDKTVAVCDSLNRVMVQKRDKTWQVHPITRGIEINPDPNHENVWWVQGDTYEYREMLKANGGHYSTYAPYAYNTGSEPHAGWRFVGECPLAVTEAANEELYSKYHFLYQMLAGSRVFMSRSAGLATAAEWWLTDGYQREMWRISGHDYRQIPVLVFRPPVGEQPVQQQLELV